MDFNFEPLDINIMEIKLYDFISIMKEFTKTSENYCFELLYNIAHNEKHEFSFERFEHLCEILGYTMIQSFSQHFVMLIGAGQNGKNSLFDGCFTSKVIPRPAANDLDSIETDRFITGSLENKAHNIFLETSTSSKAYTESKMIKALTGSMYQTIESKGISKYSGLINCKYIFSANDQDRVKFSDTTQGFRRRINMYEIYYQWDPKKAFMKKGDYYNTTFSDSLSELKDDPLNTAIYIYFAMYGIISGTKEFTKNFQFTYNDWNESYTDVDVDLKEKLERLTPINIGTYMKSGRDSSEICKVGILDLLGTPVYKSDTMKERGIYTYDAVVELFNNEESFTSYFSEHDVYISTKLLQKLVKDVGELSDFTRAVKKIYGVTSTKSMYGNKPYVKSSFAKGHFKVIF